MIVKNRTGSPYALVNKEGKTVILPAFGSIEIDPHPMHVNQYKQVGYFDISESRTEPVATVDPIDALREEYMTLSGEEADQRWKESRLKNEIQKLKGEANG